MKGGILMLAVFTGMSSVGKDKIVSEISKRYNIPVCVSHSTRPMREGEVNGVNYHFVSDSTFIYMNVTGKFLETREYKTQYGYWRYGLSKAEVDLSKHQLVILDENGYYQVLEELGKENIVPFYIHVDEPTRIMRALKRENKNDENYYMETYRRSLDDFQDFRRVSNDPLNVHRIENENLEDAINQIVEVLKDNGVIN
jgi:guanylate kinase